MKPVQGWNHNRNQKVKQLFIIEINDCLGNIWSLYWTLELTLGSFLGWSFVWLVSGGVRIWWVQFWLTGTRYTVRHPMNYTKEMFLTPACRNSDVNYVAPCEPPISDRSQDLSFLQIL